MIRVLSIGNSFSQDAQYYLHQIAANEGVELTCENLYIGGCSLELHWENIQKNAAEYQLERNGLETGVRISIQDALLSNDWDYITVQQVSKYSFRQETYLPYLERISAFIRKHAPRAKVYIHQTWAYEQDSARLEAMGFGDSHAMLARIKETYNWAAQLIHADGMIPSGEAMMNALDAGVSQIYRDTFHADLGVGRYLLGCVWYTAITGRKIFGNPIPLEIEANATDLEIARDAAQRALDTYIMERKGSNNGGVF